MKQTLADHKKWVDTNGREGKRANFTGADFTGADLRHADFTGADLRHADFTGADLRHADFTCANLRYVDFTDADLCYVDLRGVNLRGTIGDGERLISLQLPLYWVCIDTVERVMQIGCERHTIDQWYKFDDDDIFAMDGQRAVDWWAKYKNILESLCNPI